MSDQPATVQVAPDDPDHPHRFTNTSGNSARPLCIVSSPGLEQYFAGSGQELPSRIARASVLGEKELQARIASTAPLAARFGIENLPPETGEGL